MQPLISLAISNLLCQAVTEALIVGLLLTLLVFLRNVYSSFKDLYLMGMSNYSFLYNHVLIDQCVIRREQYKIKHDDNAINYPRNQSYSNF